MRIDTLPHISSRRVLDILYFSRLFIYFFDAVSNTFCNASPPQCQSFTIPYDASDGNTAAFDWILFRFRDNLLHLSAIIILLSQTKQPKHILYEEQMTRHRCSFLNASATIVQSATSLDASPYIFSLPSRDFIYSSRL